MITEKLQLVSIQKRPEITNDKEITFCLSFIAIFLYFTIIQKGRGFKCLKLWGKCIYKFLFIRFDIKYHLLRFN